MSEPINVNDPDELEAAAREAQRILVESRKHRRAKVRGLYPLLRALVARDNGHSAEQRQSAE